MWAYSQNFFKEGVKPVEDLLCHSATIVLSEQEILAQNVSQVNGYGTSKAF